MPVFVSHRYFQRASGAMHRTIPCKCTVACLPAGHVSYVQTRMCVTLPSIFFYIYIYIYTESLSLLEICLLHGLQK